MMRESLRWAVQAYRLLLLVGAPALFLFIAMAFALSGIVGGGSGMTRLATLVSYASYAFIFISLVCGILVWFRARWARIIAVVMYALLCVILSAGALMGLAYRNASPILFLFALICAGGVYLFGFNEDVKSMFRSEGVKA